MNPDIESTIEAGGCVEIVYLTASERGEGEHYMLGRERGVRAAYAYMAQEPNIWVEDFAAFGSRRLARFTLNGNKRVRLLHMRLTDPWLGKGWGSLTPLSQTESVPGHSVDSLGPAVEHYSRQDLVTVIKQIIQEYQPSTVRHLDDSITIPYTELCWRCIGHDHPDHIASAKLVHEAIAQEPGNYAEVAYVDYPSQERDANLSAMETSEKTETFRRYAWNDYRYCTEGKLCQEPAGPAAAWVGRSYYVSRRNAPPILLPGPGLGFSLFTVGEANRAANVWQSASSHWASLGGRTSDSIMAFDYQDGLAGVFARDANGLMWANTQQAAGNWQGWEMIQGSRLIALPTVSTQGPPMAIAMGNDGFFHSTTPMLTGAGWAAWRTLPPLPGALPGISIAADGNGELALFAADTSGGIWVSLHPPAKEVWSPWWKLPLPESSGGLAALRNIDGLIELYFRDKVSGHMLRVLQKQAGSAHSAWSKPADLGVAYIGSPAVSLNEKGAVAVAAIENSGGALWLMEAGQASKLAEHVASLPALGTINGALYVAARSADVPQTYWVRARRQGVWADPVQTSAPPSNGGGAFGQVQQHASTYIEPLAVARLLEPRASKVLAANTTQP